MIDRNDFIAWLEHSSRKQMLEVSDADEGLGDKPNRAAQGKPVVRRGRKARGLARKARRPSCQINKHW